MATDTPTDKTDNTSTTDNAAPTIKSDFKNYNFNENVEKSPKSTTPIPTPSPTPVTPPTQTLKVVKSEAIKFPDNFFFAKYGLIVLCFIAIIMSMVSFVLLLTLADSKEFKKSLGVYAIKANKMKGPAITGGIILLVSRVILFVFVLFATGFKSRVCLSFAGLLSLIQYPIAVFVISFFVWDHLPGVAWVLVAIFAFWFQNLIFKYRKLNPRPQGNYNYQTQHPVQPTTPLHELIYGGGTIRESVPATPLVSTTPQGGKVVVIPNTAAPWMNDDYDPFDDDDDMLGPMMYGRRRYGYGYGGYGRRYGRRW